MAGFQLTPERFGSRLNLIPGLPETVRAYSVTGDGNTDDYAALNEVAIKFGTTGHAYFPAGTYRVGTNLTLNCLCEFAPGATFDPDSGVTVTLAGPVRTAPGSSIVAAGTAGTVSITGPMDAGSGVLNVKAFGAVGDGVTDDTAAVLRAFTAGASGVARIEFPFGIYRLPLCQTLTIPDGCVVDLGGSTIEVPTFATTDDVVFDMGNDSTLQNGTIAVTLAGVAASGDKNIPVRVGLYRAYPSGKQNVVIQNLFLDGTNAGQNSNLIGVFGDTENLVVRNVRCEGGGRVGRAFLAHWSAADVDNPAVTSHPHSIVIDGFSTTGLATIYGDGGSVCLSACYNVSIRNVTSNGGYLAMNLLPGDWGADFASAAERQLIGTGIVAQGVVSNGTLRGVNLVAVPTVSGDPLAYPIQLIGCAFTGTQNASHNGIILDTAKGVQVIGCIAEKFNHGLAAADDLEDLVVIGGHFRDNLGQGIRLTNITNPPKRSRIIGATIERNNVGGQSGDDRAGINCAVSEGTVIEYCVFGDPVAETQFYSVRAADTTVGIALLHNHTRNLASSGVAYSVGANTQFDIGATGFGNTAESGLTLRGGVSLSLARDAAANLVRDARFVGGTAAPATATWIQGDAAWRSNAVATGPTGWVCAAPGTPGTWVGHSHTVGISSDRGNTDVTLSIVSGVPTQRFATALTADRAVTLPTDSAVVAGSRYRIVRQATATGAFNLNVGTGPLKALGSAGTWCDVEYDGSAWILTASGSL